MDRRQLLTGGAIAAVGTTLAAPAIAQSQPEVTWRLASSYPTSLDTIFGASKDLAEIVETITEGKFKIQVYSAGELVPPLQVMDAVGDNTVEMGQSAAYFYTGKDSAFAFGTAMPWMGNARQYNAWIYRGGGQELFNEFLEPYGVYHLPGGNTGTQMAGWYRKEIKSLADLKGLKMRIGGLGGAVLARLGVVPQQLAAGDIYPSLERGVIDAAEFVGPYDDEKLGFVKVAPYYYYPGFWEGQAELSFFINKGQWEGLPESYRTALATATRVAAANQLTKYDAGNAAALKRLIAAGAQLRPFPQDIIEAGYKETMAMYAEMSAANPKFKTLYDSLSAFLAESDTFLSISDFYFDYSRYIARQKGWDKA
ncbi:ABC transporter substrate-binding protein [Acuticoccus sediminis]|uniref:ABC transporter substrate-binding protein n=1 Tax=Acuticoccus sediminis TaxID=2184697 RepID=A0A8B2NGR6_9HYPH|nr:TRAP transporter substrate-binding protein DctP [Acuticoccus sediminis]RAH98321.1 ABC transporter substrate-binding protein [Acuticoccus sediminis]